MVGWNPWTTLLAHHLHARLAWRLGPLLLGGIFARGRRTVASWLHAVGIRCWSGYYYFLGNLGRQTVAIAGSLPRLALDILGVGNGLLFARDDTPTPGYGPKVRGAAIHHNPTPGPTDQKFLCGPLWVTLAWIVRDAAEREQEPQRGRYSHLGPEVYEPIWFPPLAGHRSQDIAALVS